VPIRAAALIVPSPSEASANGRKLFPSPRPKNLSSRTALHRSTESPVNGAKDCRHFSIATGSALGTMDVSAAVGLSRFLHITGWAGASLGVERSSYLLGGRSYPICWRFLPCSRFRLIS
jgi:hypothetical protein